MSDALEDAVKDGVEAMEKALYLQGVELVRELSVVGKATGKAALATLNAFTSIGEWYSLGLIDADSARISSENYLAVLYLMSKKATIDAEIAAWQRGIALLKTFVTVAMAVLEIAMQVALPSVGAILHNVVSRVTEELYPNA